MEKKWFQRSYRRQLQDLHIPDWNDAFLSELDHKKIVDHIVSGKMTAATLFANTHTGLCNFPSNVGEMHRYLKGKDPLGEWIDNLHDKGIDVIIYYCTIFTDWYYDNHPEARTVDASGVSRKLTINKEGHPQRFSLCCMNNPGYRKFVVTQLTEICTNYNFEGVWPDMTFWPTVCYCSACRERYNQEIGGEIPAVINWEDSTWVRFQRKREEWLVEFADMVTSTIKRLKPGVSVAHQSLTYTGDWLLGASVELSRTTDWLSSDLYRDRDDMSFLSKLFYTLSENKPYEHLNSWCYPNIHEHVVTRTEEGIRCIAFDALMNHGAFVFIDAIDPVGTVNPKSYEKAGRVFADIEKYEEYTGGKPCRDVGIYYSFESLFDLEESGMDVFKAGYNCEVLKQRKPSAEMHGEAAIAMAKALLQNHIPYGVVTRKNLDELREYQLVILPNTVMLGNEEVEALKRYVSEGGTLYASRNTSLISSEGCRQENFLLSELFGVNYVGETGETVTYVAPMQGKEDLFHEFSAKYPVTLHGRQNIVQLNGNAQVLATVMLPYTSPEDIRYSSILTDPPGVSTDHPAIVLNNYGKGEVIYTAGALETWDYDPQRAVLGNLLKLLISKPCFFETNAPKPVEITMFNREDKGSYIINVLNFQKELPNIPIENITIRVRMDGKKPKKLAAIPNGGEIFFTCISDRVEFSAKRLETFLMFQLDYE